MKPLSTSTEPQGSKCCTNPRVWPNTQSALASSVASSKTEFWMLSGRCSGPKMHISAPGLENASDSEAITASRVNPGASSAKFITPPGAGTLLIHFPSSSTRGCKMPRRAPRSAHTSSVPWCSARSPAMRYAEPLTFLPCSVRSLRSLHSIGKPNLLTSVNRIFSAFAVLSNSARGEMIPQFRFPMSWNTVPPPERLRTTSISSTLASFQGF
mmetsp:Transcript_142247/g.251005  ORF Transcript_142247/g.251005 Transcript_142247/m.251005 type:complete len:212 (+) Transcript_142247:133-768(+)